MSNVRVSRRRSFDEKDGRALLREMIALESQCKRRSSVRSISKHRERERERVNKRVLVSERFKFNSRMIYTDVSEIKVHGSYERRTKEKTE